ncbi:MAG: alpha/beta fold hydrolase [Flavitalea sp.]
MKKIYCISGLGADHRVFENLGNDQLETVPVNWLEPLLNESMHGYAKRMAGQINDENPILLGLSFGGMMAIELSRVLHVKKIFLISSIKTGSELPGWMSLCGKYHLEKYLPNKQIGTVKPLRLLRPIQNYFLGVTNEREKRIANEFRDTVDPVYLKWSLNQVMNWKNKEWPSHLVQIHGDKDHIFPISKLNPDYTIKGGGHFMVMNRYDEIRKIILDSL